MATFATDVGSIGPASVQDMCQSQVVSTGASRLASLLVDTVIPKNGEDSSSWVNKMKDRIDINWKGYLLYISAMDSYLFIDIH